MKIKKILKNAVSYVKKSASAWWDDDKTFVPLSEFFSGMFSGRDKYEKAYKNWVATCVDLISDNFAVIDLKLFKRKLDGSAEQVFSHPSLDLLQKVNNGDTQFTAFYRVAAERELNGNSYWYIPKGQDEIIPLPVNATKFILTNDRIPKVKRWESIIQKPSGTPTKLIIEPDEMVHFRSFNPFGNPAIPHYGMGTVETAITSILLDDSSNVWNHKFFQNSARPDIALEFKGILEDPVRKRIKKDWDNNFRGSRKSHKLALIEGGAKINTLGISQKEMDFVKQKEISRDEILAFFKVPKDLLGMVQSSNRATVQGSREIFAINKIDPLMRWFVNFLNEFFLPIVAPNEDLFYEYKTPVPEDADHKLKKNQFEVTNAIKTPNEVRAEQGLEPYTGGDEFLRQGALVSQGTLKTQKKIFKRGYVNTKKHLFANPVDRERLAKSIKKSIKFSKEKMHYRTKMTEADDTELKKIFKKFVKMSDKEIEKFEKMTVKEMDKQEIRVLKNLKKEMKSYRKKIAVDDIFDFEKEKDIFTKNSLTTYFSVYKSGAQDALAKIGSSETYVMTPKTKKGIEKRAEKFFGGEVNKTTETALAKRIADSVAANEGIDELTERIEDLYASMKVGRAEVIARTESLNAINDAQLTVYNDDDTVENLQWVATLDNRTRDTHMALNGQVIKKGETFDLGGIEVERPLDPVLPPAESINCRCSLIGISK